MNQDSSSFLPTVRMHGQRHYATSGWLHFLDEGRGLKRQGFSKKCDSTQLSLPGPGNSPVTSPGGGGLS